MLAYVIHIATAFLAVFYLAKDWSSHKTSWRRVAVLALIVLIAIGGMLNTNHSNTQQDNLTREVKSLRKDLAPFKKTAQIRYPQTTEEDALKRLQNQLEGMAAQYKALQSYGIQNQDMLRKMSKLDFCPVMRLDTLFRSAGKVPPHFTLTNVGSVDAVQVKACLLSHRYSPKKGIMYASVSSSSNDIVIPLLRPHEQRSFKFPDSWLGINARIERPEENNVMEIQVTYRRPQDLERYDVSAYYFVNPQGIWVPEADKSLDTDVYKRIKLALIDPMSSNNVKVPHDEGDRLHAVK